MLTERLPALSGPAWSSMAPLPGGDFPMQSADELFARFRAKYPFLDPDWAERMIKAYGTVAWTVLGDASCLASCGRHFGHGLTQREVDYLINREWAETAGDILWRRTKLGLIFSPDEVSVLAKFLVIPRETT